MTDDVVKTGPLSCERAILGFFDAFGAQKGLIDGKFKAAVRKLIEEKGELRRSTLRKVVEDGLPGLPRPIETFRQPIRLQRVLTLADVCETLVAEFLSEGKDGEGTDRGAERTMEETLSDRPSPSSSNSDNGVRQSRPELRQKRKPGRPPKRPRV